MGSNSAPIVADAFLFVLERDLVASAEGIILFKRYRDDLFAIFRSIVEAEHFGNAYNALHPRIKLEVAISTTSADVLDVRIQKFEDGSLRTGVYFKPMNALPLLHARSNHPEATKRAAISGRILNFVRISNNSTDLVNAILSLASSAERYGYRDADILSIARETIAGCADQDWPYLKKNPDKQRPKRDWRPPQPVTFVSALQPLYSVAKRRKQRLHVTFGSSLVKQLCRTKDC